MSTAMLRVSRRTRDIIMSIAANDYGGVTMDEALGRLAKEHWQRRAIEEMDRYRAEHPEGWRDYLDEMDDIERLDDHVIEP